MKKLIATLAVAGLGAGLASGAQAQVVSQSGPSGPGSLYVLNVSLATPPPATTGLPTTTPPNVAGYLYDYTVSVASITPGLNVDQFNITGIDGYVPGSASVTSEGPTDFAPTGGLGAVFSASRGFEAVGDTATFEVESTFPTASQTPGVSFSTNGDPAGSTTNAGGGKGLGPGPAVPESSSFALIGLGLLPIALVARRRISRRS